ncbi:MAG: cytochrome c3 family protein [Thermodesulfobacteriota bacterium]|nr:cytochrome c3 family protein [Thermodesulfobacteriota bacterium]
MVNIFVWLVICVFLFADNLYAGPYTSSAHGDSAYGVSRRGTSQYGRGHCAHCHEQHASIDGDEPEPDGNAPSKWCLFSNNFETLATSSPYSKEDNVCFYCHYSTAGSIQSLPGFNNYSYSYTFGGATSLTSPDNIFDAFYSPSYHNLKDIYDFITGARGSHINFANFPADSNPCSGCHNVHIARRNKAYPGNPSYTAISRPSQHTSLWGDDPAERMSSVTYGTNYQPPYYRGLTNLEPDGASNDRAIQAAKTPDYVTFCTDCHNATNTIESTTLGRTVRKIDWANSVHGMQDSWRRLDTDERRPPYRAVNKNYVLACTDCHEPHGSPNYGYLIRKTVNGGVTDVKANTNSDWNTLCNKCHTHSHSMQSCINCHYHGAEHMHGRPIF